MQLAQLGIQNTRVGRGHDIFLVIGDSIAAGLTTHTASTLPAAGTALEYDRNTDTVIPFGQGAGITGFSFNTKSPWAKFCIDHYQNTGRIPVIINRAASASTISEALSGLVGNDWQTTGTNYNDAVTAADNCLSIMGQSTLAGILVILGINDVQGQSGTGSFTVSQVGTYLGTLVTNLQSDFGSSVPIHFAAIGQTSSIRIDQRLTGIRNVIKQRCVSTTACQIGANLAAFEDRGLYADGIHPNRDGNDMLGTQFARSFKYKASYSKWPLAIISSFHTDVTTAYKALIETWFSNHLTEYLTGVDCMYMLKGPTAGDVAFDWAFYCAPNNYGGYTFAANDYIESTGATTGIFNLGYDPEKTTVNSTATDISDDTTITSNITGTGVTASLTGAIRTTPSTRATLMRQLSTNGINFAMLSATSYTYAGENFFSAGSWKALRVTGGTISLLKNGSVVSGPTTDTATATASGEWFLGCHNQNNGTKTQPIAARFRRFIIAKNSVISNETTWYNDLQTLQNY